MTYLMTDDLLEFDTPSVLIVLEKTARDRALQFSQEFGNPARQWNIYLQSLALSSFEQWLAQREPELVVQTENCSLSNPEYANILDVITNIKIGEFKICLIPKLAWSGEGVEIPQAVIDLPEYTAHFYVVVALDEASEVATIQGFATYDLLARDRANFQAQKDWTLFIPNSFLNFDLDRLLLYLQCLEPEAIYQPALQLNRQEILQSFQKELKTLLPTLTNRSLWQALTWEQGVAILTHPDLLHWVYQLQSQTPELNPNYLSDLLNLLAQTATNVGHWIQDRVDELAQNLTWEIIDRPQPNLSPMMSMRNSSFQHISSDKRSEEINNILAEIQQNYDLEIPSEFGCAYQDLTFNRGMRLYGMTWEISDEKNWSLLLILGAIPGQPFSSKMQWRISDKTGILIEESLQLESENDYLLAQLIGDYNEKFLLTLISETGEEFVLPPLGFSN